MRNRWSSPITAAAALAVSAAMQVVPALTQILPVSPGTSVPSPALKTPWGEPDLQGIWTDEFDTPLQRPAKYADQELFTEAQREELDKERTEVLNRRAVGTPNDAYNFAVFLTTKRTGARTSKIIDPPSGRIPSLTPETQKAAAADREFRLALLQAHARTGCRPVQEATTIRCPRPDAPKLRLATTRSILEGLIATTVRRTARWRTAV
jgi:hypothetical protein